MDPPSILACLINKPLNLKSELLQFFFIDLELSCSYKDFCNYDVMITVFMVSLILYFAVTIVCGEAVTIRNATPQTMRNYILNHV